MATEVATGTNVVSGGVTIGAANFRTAPTGEMGNSKEGSVVDATMVLGKGGSLKEGTEVKTGKSTGEAETFEKIYGNGADACTFGAGTL